MTQQYLVGELSLILGELQTVAANEAAVLEVASLRREAETRPLPALASVAARALQLTDDWCWDSLAQGDAAALDRQGSDLRGTVGVHHLRWPGLKIAS
jgi:hypothetical protein